MKARVKGIINKIRGLESRKKLTVAYIILSLAFVLTVRNITLERLFSSVIDLVLSIAHWFVFIFEDTFEAILGYVPQVNATVTQIPEINIQDYLSFDLTVLTSKLENLGDNFFDLWNFSVYNRWLLWNFYKITYYLSNVFFLPVMLFVAAKEMMLMENDKELGHKSSGVVRFEKLFAKTKGIYVRFYSFFEGLYDSTKARYLLILIWLINFNVLTVIIEFFAYYFYFVSSFDFWSLGSQLLKLVIDLIIGLFAGKLSFWLVLAYFGFDYYRKRIGYNLLQKYEAENCGFCKETNICSLIVASMRKGKTAFMTSMKLSWVNIHKRQMRDVLHKYDFMFPMFPWELFEKDLKEALELKLIKSTAHAALFVQIKREFFENAPCPAYLYNYDYDTFGLEKNVGNRIVTIFQAMDTYARAYYVYMNKNLDFSNYPIRFDGKFTDSPFLPRWNGEFFEIEPGERESRYSHIIDQDIFRMKKMVDPDNKHAGALSVGFYSVMEFGKSEKNQLALEGVSATDEKANQKNDGYENSLYMLGHAEVMIDNICVANFLADDQRPMAIPAKLRDCFSIITLVDRSDVQLALPFFAVEEWCYDHIYEPFKKFYEDYRELRGDRTVPLLLLKLAVSALSNYYAKIYNTFGYFEYEVALESGTSYGEGSPADRGAKFYKYRIFFKKDFGDRYKTDGQSQFFNKRLLDCECPLDDFDCYTSLNMSVDEMDKQHDYFNMEMLRSIYGDREDKYDSVKVSSANNKPSYRKNDIPDIECDII